MPSSKSQDYDVEKVVGKRITKGRTYYLIKWRGYSSTENTWEPESHVQNCQDLVKAFEAEHEKKNQSKSSEVNKSQDQRSVRSTRSSQSPQKKLQRSPRNSNRSLPNYKDSSSGDDMFSEDEDAINKSFQEKRSLLPKRSQQSLNDTNKNSSIDNHNTDILDSDKLDHIVDVRRNTKRKTVEYCIQGKKNKKSTWINSSRLAEKYSQQVIDFLEEKYI